MKILYCCVGCSEIHYDDDYEKKDGDIIIIDFKRFFESIKRVKSEMKKESGK